MKTKWTGTSHNSKSAVCFVCAALISVQCTLAQQQGSNRNTGENSRKRTATSTTQSNSANQTDRRVQQAIENRLQWNPDVAAHLIDVSVRNGSVTLEGTVDDLLSAELAERIAQSTRGVHSVTNRLSANPVARPDDDLQRDIERALLLDPAADSYEVDVAVNKGVATLNGTVESFHEKQLAERLAKSVRGVRKVNNEVEVAFNQKRLSSEVASDIRSRIRNDARLNGENLNVRVADNIAYLSGSVKSALDKYRATSDAWVAGVKWVDATDVEIQTEAPIDNTTREATQSAQRPGEQRAGRGTAGDRQSGSGHEQKKSKASVLSNRSGDAAIEQAVKDALLYDPRVYSFNPEVEVNNGVVTLTGTVEDAKAKRAAESDARNVVGVKSVRNLLKVRNASQPTDTEIRKNVQDALHRTTRLSDDQVLVSVLNGKVTLSGTVDTFLERSIAEDVAMGVKGVLDIDNYVGVPMYNNDYTSGYTWYGYPDHWSSIDWLGNDSAWKSDFEIEKDVEDQMFWSPYVDADEVNVSVRNGIATLSGTVDSYHERSFAIKNAYDAGATDVHDNLNISFEGDPLF